MREFWKNNCLIVNEMMDYVFLICVCLVVGGVSAALSRRFDLPPTERLHWKPEDRVGSSDARFVD